MATEVESKRDEIIEEGADETFSEAILGKGVGQEGWARAFMRLSPTWRVASVIATLGALLFIPYLGAVGLWDPWEVHYGEVAREMIQRNDYVYPYWESAWFFSKPPMTMWLQAIGMQWVGANEPNPGLREWLPTLLLFLAVIAGVVFLGWRKGRLVTGLKAAGVIAVLGLIIHFVWHHSSERVDTGGGLGLFTEWGMRLPFVLLSILALTLLSVALARTVNVRTGLAVGFVLATMPLYFLLTRQTVTDTPFVTTLICAMSCAIIGQLDPNTRHRAAWWYAFYVFAGISTLAKGLLGVGLPAVILVIYAFLSVLPNEAKGWSAHLRWLTDSDYRAAVRAGRDPMPVLFAQMLRMKLGTGILVFFAVAAPWYVTLSLFPGVDDEGKDFFTRFFIHDHLNRLGAGVHTTTPYGSFTYFIEQGGYAIFPWVAAIPGAIAVASRLRLRSANPADHVGVIGVVWVAFSFFLLGSSATKFHHYVFPILPGVAILVALFIDRLWREGIAKHAVPILFGAVLFGLVGKDLVSPNAAKLPGTKHFTDLFVYNYDRPYPAELATRAIGYISGRAITMGDLITFVLLAFAAYLVVEAFIGKPSSKGSKIFAGVVAVAAIASAVKAFGGGKSSSKLFSEPANLLTTLGLVFVVVAVIALIGAIHRSRTMVFGTMAAFALGFALWFNWSHWVDLSHHWTQRDQFWLYHRGRAPGEPITAFLMNWRGETFYSRNTVVQIKDNARMRAYADQPGREWALVEHYRLNILRNAVGADKKVTVIDRDSNNKFTLVTIE